jgi:hypothetical protein
MDDPLGPWDEWFEPNAGIAAFQALANLIRSKPKVARKLENAEGVVYELEELVRVLGIAKQKRAGFRLEMS